MRQFLSKNRKLFWRLGIFGTLALGIAAVALPNFVNNRCGSPQNACINNLRQIDGAKEQWALETRQINGAPGLVGEIDQYIKGGHPNCPKGGTYQYGNVGEAPRCSIAGHELR